MCCCWKQPVASCLWKMCKINTLESVYQIKSPQFCRPVCLCSPSRSGSVASHSPIMLLLWLCEENGCLLRKYISAGTSTAGEMVNGGENLRQLSAGHDRKVNGKMCSRHTNNVWCRILSQIFTVKNLTDGAMSDCLHEHWIASLLLILQRSITVTHYSAPFFWERMHSVCLSQPLSCQSCLDLKAKFTHYPVTTVGGGEEEK